jgi:anti-sigma regulatory factor (Ser/Thr protein kinase)
VSSVVEQSAAVHHVVHFYESDDDLAVRVGAYLDDAARAGSVGIVIATAAHRAAFEDRSRDGTVVWLDAAETLASLTRDGRIDRQAFFDVVGTVVRDAAATGRRVHAYGEMVALLWDAGDVMAAIELESLWNELAAEVPFSLYCAYPSASVAGHEHADALEHVCRLHTAVVSPPPVEATWRFGAEFTAPADARRLLTDALRRSGHHGRTLADARIVVTELAANAVRHAHSPFSVSVRSRDSTVRIGVRDESRVLPTVPGDPTPTTLSGRGLRLVAALATRSGVDVTADGKVVWAELRP